MKNKILISLIILLAIFIISCDDSFSPKADFKERYILYCIMNIDSSKQSAFLLKSYDVAGFDPYVNEKSSFISDADIKIRQRDKVFFMRDTSAIVDGVSRYNEAINFYHLENFATAGNDSIEIIVTLSSGKKLYSITKSPESIQFDSSSDKVLPPEEKDNYSFYWTELGPTIWYLPKLEFFYIIDGFTKSKTIPITYQTVNGNFQPVYPAPRNENFVNFTVSALNTVFSEISEGDPNKSSYKILGAKLSILVFNEELSNYYSTTNGFLDDYTIILDEKDYTNINGGYGVFGIYKQQQSGAKFTEEYIQSFGYTVGLN